jgi:hypothetical protein
MYLSPLARVAAPIALVAGALIIATRVATLVIIPADLTALKVAVLEPAHAINGPATIVAFALLVVALVAIYERQAHAAGWLGVIGVGAAIVGTVFMAGDYWYEAFAVPRIAELAPEAIDTFVGGRLLTGGLTSFALMGIGWTLFAAASLRAGVFPRTVSIGMLLGGVASGLPMAGAYLFGGIILGLAVAWLGVSMMRAPAAAVVPQPAAI